MKRSRINQVIRETEELLARHQIFLPPFFGWTPGEWAEKGPECREIRDNGAGILRISAAGILTKWA